MAAEKRARPPLPARGLGGPGKPPSPPKGLSKRAAKEPLPPSPMRKPLGPAERRPLPTPSSGAGLTRQMLSLDSTQLDARSESQRAEPLHPPMVVDRSLSTPGRALRASTEAQDLPVPLGPGRSAQATLPGLAQSPVVGPNQQLAARAGATRSQSGSDPSRERYRGPECTPGPPNQGRLSDRDVRAGCDPAKGEQRAAATTSYTGVRCSACTGEKNARALVSVRRRWSNRVLHGCVLLGHRLQWSRRKNDGSPAHQPRHDGHPSVCAPSRDFEAGAAYCRKGNSWRG